MNIKIPKFRIIRPQHAQLVAEDIIKVYLRMAFWISPLALWKVWELIKPLINNLKSFF